MKGGKKEERKKARDGEWWGCCFKPGGKERLYLGRRHLSRGLKEVREQARQLCEETVFQVEENANAKALRGSVFEKQQKGQSG